MIQAIMIAPYRVNETLVGILRWGIVALIVAVPLFYAPWFLFPFVFGKAVLLHLGVELLLIVWLTLALRDKQYLPQPSLLVWAYLLFVSWMLLASALGINFERSFWSDPSRMTGLFTLMHVAALALMVERIAGKAFQGVILEAVGASGTIVAALGFVLEFLARQGGGIYTGYQGRIVGTLGNPIYFAVYLVPLIFVTTLLAWPERSGIRDQGLGISVWLWRGALAIQILALAFAGSRGGLIGLALGIVVALAILLVQKRRGKIWAQAGLVLGAFAIIFGGLFTVGRIAQDALPPQIQKLVLFSSADITTSTRLTNWRIAYRAWRARPWTGWGVENYRDAFDRHFDPSLLRFSLYEAVSDKPHNSFLEIVVAGGVIGFILYLAVVGLVLGLLLAGARRGAMPPRAAALVGGAFAAYWGSGLFAFDSPSSLLVFGVLLGWVGSGKWEVGMRNAECGMRTLEVGSSRARSVVLGGATVALLALSPFGNILPLRSLYHASEAGRYAERNAFKWFDEIKLALISPYPYRDEIRKLLTSDFLQWEAGGDFPATFAPQAYRVLRDAMQDSTKRHPEYFTWHFLLAQLAIASTEEGNVDEVTTAREELAAAKAIAPRHQAAYMLGGRLALLEHDMDRAIQEMKTAIELDPFANQPHWFLALVYTAAGREGDAIREYEAARDLGKSFESRDEVLLIADLYAKQKDYPQLIRIFTDAVRVDPAHAADWYARLAATYGLMGEQDKAAEAAREAVAHDPAIGKEAQEFLQKLQ